MTVQSLRSKVQSPGCEDGCAARLAARKAVEGYRTPRRWRAFECADSALASWSAPAPWRFVIAALSAFAPGLALSAATNSTPPDAIPPLRPPHAEIPPTFWDQYGLWIAILGVLLLGLVCAVVWFLTRPKPPVVVPPEVQARQALEPLRQHPEDGALLSRVSQILRHYVAAAFELPPGELTTAEFCSAMAGHAHIGPELSAALSGFLRQCDQRKFSTLSAAPPFSAVPQALQLVDQAQARRLALAQPAAPPTQSSAASPPKEVVKQ